MSLRDHTMIEALEERARFLATEILRLESSPLQRDYVPSHIYQLARELLAVTGPSSDDPETLQK